MATLILSFVSENAQMRYLNVYLGDVQVFSTRSVKRPGLIIDCNLLLYLHKDHVWAHEKSLGTFVIQKSFLPLPQLRYLLQLTRWDKRVCGILIWSSKTADASWHLSCTKGPWQLSLRYQGETHVQNFSCLIKVLHFLLFVSWNCTFSPLSPLSFYP